MLVCKIVIFNPHLWNRAYFFVFDLLSFYTYAFSSCLCSLSFLFCISLFLFGLIFIPPVLSPFSRSHRLSVLLSFVTLSFSPMCMTCSQLGIVLMCDSHCDVLCLFSVSKSVEEGETVMRITISNLPFLFLLNVMLPGRGSGPQPERRH